MGNLAFQEVLFIIALAATVIPFILYLVALQNALKTISPRNRKMEPGNVWVMLVPFLNAVFIYFIAAAVAASFKREFEEYGVFKDEKQNYYLGIAMGILFTVGIFIRPVALAGLVCLVIHWIIIAKEKKEIIALKENNIPGKIETSIFTQ